jgi:hypothetical protein
MNHHATLLRSSRPLDFQYETDNSVSLFSFERLGIDNARQIATDAQLKPVSGAEQVFVLRTLFVTHEAQNALLKLFEEPPAGLSFILVLPPAVQLLPTLLSRIGQEVAEQPDVVINQPWVDFLAATPADRLTQIDLWQKTKESNWLQAITAGVHTISYTEVPVGALPAIQLVGEQLGTRGASNKMLLEHLALILPLRN